MAKIVTGTLNVPPRSNNSLKEDIKDEIKNASVDYSQLTNIPVLKIGDYVFDGSSDLTIPVYNGSIK